MAKHDDHDQAVNDELPEETPVKRFDERYPEGVLTGWDKIDVIMFHSDGTPYVVAA